MLKKFSYLFLRIKNFFKRSFKLDPPEQAWYNHCKAYYSDQSKKKAFIQRFLENIKLINWRLSQHWAGCLYLWKNEGGVNYYQLRNSMPKKDWEDFLRNEFK